MKQLVLLSILFLFISCDAGNNYLTGDVSEIGSVASDTCNDREFFVETGVKKERSRINPFKGPYDPSNNYNYFSFSGHPKIGARPEYNQTKIFLYEYNKEFFLYVLHNVDDARDHPMEADLDFIVKRNLNRDGIIISDEADELVILSRQNFQTVYRWDSWHNTNTDGFVIGPLIGGFEIEIDKTNLSDFKKVEFRGPSHPPINLGTDPGKVTIISKPGPTC